jgi:ribosomal protein S18 acetylase RimI-like enzyme
VSANLTESVPAIHLLDNPIWNALTTSRSTLSLGGELARRFPAAISPLAGLRENTVECHLALADLLPPDTVAVLFLDKLPEAFPVGLTQFRRMDIFQMVWSGSLPDAKPDAPAILQLRQADVSEMVALTSLTNPGPFGERTYEFGTYLGIREGGRLAAMAGERLRVPGFTEVSAVCTHPDFRGRGYAARLMTAVMRGILDRGDTPFLHVAAENAGAIRVYKSLGFEKRIAFEVAVLRREDPSEQTSL